jgi:predicted Zn-dependent protease with MMP-like domain
MAPRFTTPPTLDDLAAIAEQALAAIPEELRAHVGNVVLRVDEFPDEEIERDMELESPFDILGLYRGVDLTRKSVSDPRPQVDMIFLYRRPLLDYWCESDEELADVVRNVLIHEIGHHFGLSDDDMERLERDA